MDHKRKTPSKAASAEPRHDRQLAVMLEGVLDMELSAARHQLDETNTRLVERALRLLRSSRMPEGFLTSPFEPDRHAPLLDLAGSKRGER